MDSTDREKILFIINSRAGNHSINWEKEIEDYFESLPYSFEIYKLKDDCSFEEIKKKITSFNPDKVVAVGGDGTVNLVAQGVLQKNIALGILPAGSANGLAKELGISEIPTVALQTLTKGVIKKIHVLKINGNLCIHLSDIGHNARMIKKFQSENIRGFWGYLKATLKVANNVLFLNPKMQVSMTIDHKIINAEAAMIVIANATKYGSGAVINPSGNLEDEVFEVIVIKEISLREIFKMMVSHTSFDPQKTQVFKAKSLILNVSKSIHFQVDGEYLGKVKVIEVGLIPAALQILVPPTSVL